MPVQVACVRGRCSAHKCCRCEVKSARQSCDEPFRIRDFNLDHPQIGIASTPLTNFHRKFVRFINILDRSAHKDSVPAALRHALEQFRRAIATCYYNRDRSGIALALREHGGEAAERFGKAPDRCHLQMRGEPALHLSAAARVAGEAGERDSRAHEGPGSAADFVAVGIHQSGLRDQHPLAAADPSTF